MGEFVKAAETKDIQPSMMMAVEVNGEKVCIANVEGKYYAQVMYALIWVALQQKEGLRAVQFNVHGMDLDSILQLARY